MEIVMVITLAIMGVYFFKSTDLPKDLRERSAQFEAEASRSLPQTKTLRMTLPKELNSIPAIDKNVEAKLVLMKAQKKNKEIQLLNQEIDKLTLAITTLEQEIKENNERNSEIQATIDSHLLSLISLQEQINLLA